MDQTEQLLQKALKNDIYKLDGAIHGLWYCEFYETNERLRKIMKLQIEVLQQLREDICGERYTFPDEYLSFNK